MKRIKSKPARVFIADCLMTIYLRVYTQQPDLLGLLANSFTEDSEDSRNMVLEILEVLPELMTDEKVVIEDELRKNFIEFAMKNLQPGVLKTLSDACAVPGLATRRRYQLLNCFHAWMIEETTEEVKQQIHTLNLLPFCYNELMLEGENNEEAADAIIGCMVVCKDAALYPNLYQSIIQGLFSGRTQFEAFVREQKEEEVQFYITVYSVLVSRIFDQILEDPNNSAIRFMLEGVFLRVMKESKREMVSKTTVAITSIIKKLQLDEQAGPDKLAKVSSFVNLYQSWFEAIIDAACTHSQLSDVGAAD